MDKSRFEQIIELARLKAAEVKAQRAAEGLETDVGHPTAITNVDSSNETNERSIEARDISSDVFAGPQTERQDSDDQEPGKQVPGVARDVTLNDKQQQFYDAVLQGGNIVLIGAAGTGKTTATGRTTKGLMETGKLGKITNPTKRLQVGLPGAVVLSYTRKAVNNIRYAVAEELKAHTMTIHALLEFAPVKYEIEDPDRPGEFKLTMRFEPKRNTANPLPPELKLLVFEESSMISVDLYHMLQEAMPHKHQEIFLGDIQQLPPIFGLAILGFKMLELPVVELTEVYRQALESPIIDLAWKILSGNQDIFARKTTTEQRMHPHLGRTVSRLVVPSLEALSVTNDKGSVKFQPWQKKLSPEMALNVFTKQIVTWEEEGYYNAETDIILCPFNKAFGTVEINSGISDYLGRKRNALVYEVIAGFRKHYLAVGDRVLYDKEDAYITEINKNGNYLGATRPQPASENLDRWGHQQVKLSTEEVTKDVIAVEVDIDAFLENITEDATERVQAASHVITIKYAMSDETESLDKASDINNLLGGYAITVHKSQGSEYRRVFMALHNSHAMMISRELLYTAVTRASRYLHIVCEIDTFYKGVAQQRITGNTLADKAVFFKGKESDYNKKKAEMEENRRGAEDFKPQEPVKKPETAIAIAAQAHPMVPLVNMSDLVPEYIKAQFKDHLIKTWRKAKQIFGDEIGSLPTLSFNLQKHDILGRASFKSKTISINPVWCCAIDIYMGSEAATAIAKVLTADTLVHEACHLIAGIVSRDFGHGSGWKMAMKLMGVVPTRMYEGDDLPPWAETYMSIIEETKKKLAEKNADLSERDVEDVSS